MKTECCKNCELQKHELHLCECHTSHAISHTITGGKQILIIPDNATYDGKKGPVIELQSREEAFEAGRQTAKNKKPIRVNEHDQHRNN